MQDLTLQLLARDAWVWGLVLIPALALAFFAYYRILAPVSSSTRIVLWLLRGLAFVLVIFALWQPTLSYVVPDSGKPRLALLVDRSGSMVLPASEQQFANRGEEAEARARAVAEELGSDYALEWFEFGERLVPADSAGSREGHTAIGGALEEVLVRSAARPVHGVVLVSDGVNTAGRDPVRIAKGSSVPIFTLPVGPANSPPDLEIRRIETNARAFAGEPLPLDVVVSSSGLEGQAGRIQILEDGELIEEREFEVLGDRGLEQALRFEIHPHAPGWRKYEVRAAVGDEAVPINNRREVAVEVLERKTRVLVVGDAIDWDLGFLRQTFSADTTLAYAYLVRAEGGTYRASGDKPPRTLPVSLAELEDYAAVVLVSTGRAPLPDGFLEAAGGFVARGGGLLILGGPPEGGSWSQVDGFQRILPAKAVSRPVASGSLLSVEVATQGLRHPITALRDNPTQGAALFASLPPIWKTPWALESAGNGRELLSFRGEGPGRAALVAGFGDRGKVAWLAGRGLWRWRLTAAGSDLPPRIYEDFFLGTIRWLAEPAIRERFQIEPGRRVYANGESIDFLANLWNESLQPIGDASITVEVVPDSSARETSAAPPEVSSLERNMRLELSAAGESGAYEGRGRGLAPGAYRYRARAEGSDGTALGSAAGVFWVETMGPEFARIATDRETLRQIATESAGRVVEPAALSGLGEQIPELLRRVGRVREIDVWNHWLLFAIFVLVLSMEWFLRRRRGLA